MRGSQLSAMVTNDSSQPLCKVELLRYTGLRRRCNDRHQATDKLVKITGICSHSLWSRLAVCIFDQKCDKAVSTPTASIFSLVILILTPAVLGKILLHESSLSQATGRFKFCRCDAGQGDQQWATECDETSLDRAHL